MKEGRLEETSGKGWRMIRDCDCTISHRVNGMGVVTVNPQEHIDRLTDWINEARDEI